MALRPTPRAYPLISNGELYGILFSGRMFCCRTTRRKVLTIFNAAILFLSSPRAKSGWILWPPGVGLRVNCRPLTGPSVIPVRASSLDPRPLIIS